MTAASRLIIGGPAVADLSAVCSLQRHLLPMHEFGAWGGALNFLHVGHLGHVDDVRVGSSFHLGDDLQLGVPR